MCTPFDEERLAFRKVSSLVPLPQRNTTRYNSLETSYIYISPVHAASEEYTVITACAH